MRQKITDIKLEMFPASRGNLIGHVSFTLEHAPEVSFRYQGMAIFSRPDGINLEWPNKTRDGKRVSTAFPITKAVAKDIESQIFEAIQSNSENQNANPDSRR